jgi:hypothetical protein
MENEDPIFGTKVFSADHTGHFYDNTGNIIWSPNDINAQQLPNIILPGGGLINQPDHTVLEQKVSNLEVQNHMMMSEIDSLKHELAIMKIEMAKFIKYERRSITNGGDRNKATDGAEQSGRLS